MGILRNLLESLAWGYNTTTVDTRQTHNTYMGHSGCIRAQYKQFSNTTTSYRWWCHHVGGLTYAIRSLNQRIHRGGGGIGVSLYGAGVSDVVGGGGCSAWRNCSRSRSTSAASRPARSASSSL